MAVARFSVLGCAFGLGNVSLGQEDSIPLVEDGRDLLAKRNDVFWKGESARRALQSGLYELAELYSREALAGVESDAGELRSELLLLQVDALLARGLYVDAQSLLGSLMAEGAFNQSKVLREAVLALVEEDEEGED